MEIKAGVQGKYKCENYTILVIYTTEFVKRIDDREISSTSAFNKLRESFPKLLEIADGDQQFNAIIKSRSTGLNIVLFVSSNKTNRMNVIVKTVMTKDDFIPTEIAHYEVFINPPIKIKFEPGTDKMIKFFVLRDLSTRRLVEGKVYSFDSGIVNYTIDYDGYIGVAWADWSGRMFEITVK